ncbi:MAG TPA: DUF1643 domain-containing protein [Xanthobacteraceae bacterium]|jgi:hypothetical protein
MTLFDFETEHDPGGKVRTSLPAGMIGDARFHGERNEYRLWLYRAWTEPALRPLQNTLVPFVLWIGMNPSTADSNVNDPTISRIIRFTDDFGFRACTICNVMDYRATHPSDLCQPGVVPCSDENLGTIIHAALEAEKVILCYGVVSKVLQKYPRAVVEALRSNTIPLLCLGKTATGHPRHPLYLRSDTPLESFL